MIIFPLILLTHLSLWRSIPTHHYRLVPVNFLLGLAFFFHMQRSSYLWCRDSIFWLGRGKNTLYNQNPHHTLLCNHWYPHLHPDIYNVHDVYQPNLCYNIHSELELSRNLLNGILSMLFIRKFYGSNHSVLRFHK